MTVVINSLQLVSGTNACVDEALLGIRPYTAYQNIYANNSILDPELIGFMNTYSKPNAFFGSVTRWLYFTQPHFLFLLIRNQTI